MNKNIEVITNNLWAVSFSFVKMDFIKELSFNNKGDNLLSTACTVIAGIAAELNKLPFVEFDYSGISNAASEYAAKAAEAAGNKEEYKDIGAAFNEGMSTFDAFQSGWASDAFSAGAA